MKQGNIFLLIGILFLSSGSILPSTASFENGKVSDGPSARANGDQLPETYSELLAAAQVRGNEDNGQSFIDCQPSSNKKGCCASVSNCAKCCCESSCVKYLFVGALFTIDKAYFLGFCL